MNIFKDTEKIREMEVELRMYWAATSEGRRLQREGDTLSGEIVNCREEVEVIASYTDWPRLRQVCADTIASEDRRCAEIGHPLQAAK